MVCTTKTILYLGQGPDNIQVQLVFFSTLEKLELPATSRGAKDCATAKLYVALPFPTTSLNVATDYSRKYSGQVAWVAFVPGWQFCTYYTTLASLVEPLAKV